MQKVYAHNARSLHNYFIIQELLSRKKETKVMLQGAKIISIKLENVVRAKTEDVCCEEEQCWLLDMCIPLFPGYQQRCTCQTSYGTYDTTNQPTAWPYPDPPSQITPARPLSREQHQDETYETTTSISEDVVQKAPSNQPEMSDNLQESRPESNSDQPSILLKWYRYLASSMPFLCVKGLLVKLQFKIFVRNIFILLAI